MIPNADGLNVVITGDASQAIQEIRKVENVVSGLLSLEVGKTLENGFGSMLKNIASALQSVARSVSSVVKNSLSIGGGFEAQMTSVKVISGATAEELDMLTKKAREMGATLPITAKEAAAAMTLLAQRGNDAHKILASVTAVSNLAISQAVDMASAADLLGSTITNFALSVDDADKITAVFNNACNQSALSMSKLIGAMKYAGPTASAVGMELTETVSALEAAVNAGLTGEMAGTGFQVVMSKLSKESHIFGVETKKLDNSLRDTADIFSELNKLGLTYADYVAMFGQRGAKFAVAMAKNSDSLKLNRERLKQWDSTQNAVNEKMKTFTNTLNAFQSAYEELHIEIFEQIKDQAKDAVGSVANLTRQFSKWIGETKIAGQTLNAFLNGLEFNIPSADSFQKLLNSFNVQSFLDSVQPFGSALKGIADSIVNAFSLIKTPLLFLIEHLGTFATISFWGWIIGKGLQVPAAIISIASAFTKLKTAVAGLEIIKWVTLTSHIKTFIITFQTFGVAALSPLALGSAITASIAALSVLTFKTADAYYEAQKAEKRLDNTIKRIQNEIKNADADLTSFLEEKPLQTGFEKLPESFTKASDELIAKTLETVRTLRPQFKEHFAQALDDVIKKFPQISEEAKNAGIDIQNIGNDVYSNVSKVLNGDLKAYKSLPEIFKKVTAQINRMYLELGKGNKSLPFEIMYDEIEAEAAKRQLEELIPENKFNILSQQISSNIRNVFANLPKQVEEANKFLNNSNSKLAIDVSLEKAKASLDTFVKSAADRFAIPDEIIKQSTINKFKELANQGNLIAQSLLNSWGNLSKPFDELSNKAKDYINYLGESPDTFLPALNSLAKGIQKIDPLTGKVTEQFKKFRDTLKELTNMSFDNLSKRIQKLRKAVEGGFIDQSALEFEFKKVLPQIRLQVINDLEPFKNQFSAENYQATLASDLVSIVQDLFGDVGVKLLQEQYKGQSGIEIGQSILRGLQGITTGNSSGYISINGVEQSINKVVDSFSSSSEALYPHLDNLNETVNNLISSITINSNALNNTGNSILSFIDAIRTPNSDYNEIANTFGSRANDAVTQFPYANTQNNNLSESVSSIISAIQNSNNSLAAMSEALSNNPNALNDILQAAKDIQASIAALNSGSTYNIDIHQQGFNVSSKSNADYAANATVSALRSGLGNGGM